VGGKLIAGGVNFLLFGVGGDDRRFSKADQHAVVALARRGFAPVLAFDNRIGTDQVFGQERTESFIGGSGGNAQQGCHAGKQGEGESVSTEHGSRHGGAPWL